MKPKPTRRQALVALGGLGILALTGTAAEVALDRRARIINDPALEEHPAKAFLVFLYESEHAHPPDQQTLDKLYATFIEHQVARQIDSVGLHRRTSSWLRKNVNIEGIEHLRRATEIAAARGTGVVIGTTMTGSFQTGRTRLAQELDKLGYQPELIQLTQHFPVDMIHRIVAWRFGIELIEYSGASSPERDVNRTHAIKKATDLLPGRSLLVEADLDIIGPLSEHSKVEFFGHPAVMPRGPLDAAKEDAPIVVMGTRRDKDKNKIVVQVSEVLDPREVTVEDRPQRLADLVMDAWRKTETVLHSWGLPREMGEATATTAGLHL